MGDGAPMVIQSLILTDRIIILLIFRRRSRAGNELSDEYRNWKNYPRPLSKTDVYANVFNGSERSKVEMQIGAGNRWVPMQRKVGIDPGFKKLSETENAIKGKTWRNLSKPKKSTHLWQAKLPDGLKPGTYLLRVRTVEMDGDKHQSGRVIRVIAPKAAEKTASTGRAKK